MYIYLINNNITIPLNIGTLCKSLIFRIIIGIPDADVCVCSRINMSVRRLGGGYGGKLSYASPVAASAAVAAVKLNRPVRIVLDVETNMEMYGGRLPYLIEYKVSSGRAHGVHGLLLLLLLLLLKTHEMLWSGGCYHRW